MKDFLPDMEDTFAQIGCQLLLTQDVEYYISNLIGLVFPKDQPSRSDLDKLDKKTLGVLKKELAKRVEVDEGFLEFLNEFIDKRNIFVHNLNKQDWYDIYTQEGRNEIWNFLGEYFYLLEEVKNVVLATILLSDDKSEKPTTEYQNDKIISNEFINKLKTYYPKSKVAFKTTL